MFLSRAACEHEKIQTVTVNQAAPVVLEQTKMHADNSSNTHIVVNTEKATNAADQATFIIFFLFFISALASMFGGRCGMGCRKSEITNTCCCLH